MKLRWLAIFALMSIVFALTALSVSANSTLHNDSTAAKLLRRCENNYDEEELQAIIDNGDDGYEPDDCPMLAHTLTGPMLLNFCLPGDEDWVKFKAQPNLIYQIRAEPQWNYPTEPKIELYVDGVLIAQNDHYFGNNAEVWWWNSAEARVVYLRIFELAGRHDCGNSAYTLSLHSFASNPYPPTATLTPTLILTDTVAPSVTETPTATSGK